MRDSHNKEEFRIFEIKKLVHHLTPKLHAYATLVFNAAVIWVSGE